MKLSDYVCAFLRDAGVAQLFCVPGGGAMHLNDSAAHTEGLTCVYNLHEQASAVAAEAFARVRRRAGSGHGDERAGRDERRDGRARRLARFDSRDHRLGPGQDPRPASRPASAAGRRPGGRHLRHRGADHQVCSDRAATAATIRLHLRDRRAPGQVRAPRTGLDRRAARRPGRIDRARAPARRRRRLASARPEPSRPPSTVARWRRARPRSPAFWRAPSGR